MRRLDIAPMMRYNTMRALQKLLWQERTKSGQEHWDMSDLFAKFIEECGAVNWFRMMTQYSPREVQYQGRTFTHGEWHGTVKHAQPSEPVQDTLAWVEETLGIEQESETPDASTH